MTATIWAKILIIAALGTVQNTQMCKPSDYKDPAFVWIDLGTNTGGVEIGSTCVKCDGSDFTNPANQ